MLASWRQYLAVLLASYGAFCSGIFEGWTDGVIEMMQNEQSLFPDSVPVINNQIFIFFIRMYVGALTGPFIAALLSICMGPRWIIILANIPLLIGYVLAGVASNMNTLYVARVFLGCGMSMVYTISPLYIGEIAEVKTRGTMCVCFMLFSSLGTLLSTIVSAFVSYKVLTALCAVMTLLNVPASWCMPESPVYLITEGRDKEASDILQNLRGTSEEAVQPELADLQLMVSKKLRISRGVAKAFLIIIFLLILLNRPVFASMVFLTKASFKEVGIYISDYSINVIIMVFKIVFACVTLFLVDRVGRKPILFITCVGLLVIFIILGVIFMLYGYFEYNVTKFVFVPFVCFIVYIILYPLGVGSLTWVLIAELFPVKMKIFASAISVFMYWLLAVIQYYVMFPVMFSGPSDWFFINAVCCLIAVMICFGLLPETKGKTFNQIQDTLNYRRHDAGAVISSPTAVENIQLMPHGLTTPA